MMTTKTKLQKEIEKLRIEKETLEQRKELIKLKYQVEGMEKSMKEPTGGMKFLKQMGRGASIVGKKVLDAGENLSKVNVNDSISGKRKEEK